MRSGRDVWLRMSAFAAAAPASTIGDTSTIASTVPEKASGAAGSAVFFGALAVIVVTGVILYVRRRRR